MKRIHWLRAFACALLLPASLHNPVRAQDNRPILVFAAASLKNALDEIAADWSAKNKVEIRVSYAASPALAKQIENGAPADLFISADLDWMNYVEQKNLLRAGTRQELLGNALVLIARNGFPASDIRITREFDLARLLGNERLAVANVETVPAGKYAKAALEKLGLWNAVKDRLAEAENVRAALLFVARGEAPLGIVYRTDAAQAPVNILGSFPPDSHPPIVYPAAVLRESKHPRAEDFLRSLNDLATRATFAKHGFSMIQPPRM